MRPLRLLLSLSSSLLAATILLYFVFGASNHNDQPPSALKAEKKGKLKALYSFASPASLFPPSAIISLTDDNSTFFIARPAAFGPILPSKGLSGQLWIGGGFGDDTMSGGELGCSDVPGWSDGDDSVAGSHAALYSNKGGQVPPAQNEGALGTKRAQPPTTKTPEHADIESLQETAEIAGKVVLLRRGGCGFLEKAKWAQNRGGVAVIVGDSVRGGPLIRMYARGDTANLTIPALFTTYTTAHLLSSLLPSGGVSSDLSSDDASRLEFIKSRKGNRSRKTKATASKHQHSQTRPTSTNRATRVNPTYKNNKNPAIEAGQQSQSSESDGWLTSVLHMLGVGATQRARPKGGDRRPPSSGNLDWVRVEDWDDDHAGQKSISTRATAKYKSTATPPAADFIIGEQDWRDSDLLPQSTSAVSNPKQSTLPPQQSKSEASRENILPGSGEYHKDDLKEPKHKGWFSNWLNHEVDGSQDFAEAIDGSSIALLEATPSTAHSNSHGDNLDHAEKHEGLWVTLTPAHMSSSPFFDTLLVLVVSPLVTLTVVYALLLLRSRIRRRRWRAPKSVVDSLPVRTYHTISDTNSSTATTPVRSSSTTPLLQQSPSHPASSSSRPCSRTASEALATSSFDQQGEGPQEEEKREAGLAEWRRRYGGRQKECVVCLEEYEDGISKVMSLPCGHEFHADCM
jgi:hypothetical protein